MKRVKPTYHIYLNIRQKFISQFSIQKIEGDSSPYNRIEGDSSPYQVKIFKNVKEKPYAVIYRNIP
jgi:hypothetical protein